MKRLWHTWALFVLFLAVVLAAMGWVSRELLHLRDINIEAARQAAVEESVRLALWRMDAAMTPLIVEESSRPYYDYWAYNTVKPTSPTGKDARSALTPSPLLNRTDPNINLYFNWWATPTGTGEATAPITSPQVPAGDVLSFANTMSGMEPLTLTNSARLEAFNGIISATDLQQALGQSSGSLTTAPAPATPAAEASQPRQISMEFEQRAGQTLQTQQKVRESKSQLYDARNSLDLSSPANDTAESSGYLTNSSIFSFSSFFRKSRASASKQKESAESADEAMATVAPLPPVIKEDLMRPIWVGEVLLLARTVKINDQDMIQGAWLNWERIRGDLLAGVRDLFPNAQLEPVLPASDGDKTRMLATIPARLIPGAPALMPAVSEPPLMLPLAVAWVCVIVAALAVAGLLLGATILSERRAAFVSAVTHELRTPLTTFRMYTEMLAEGMIRDESQRQDYLTTLNRESNRLGHLVENVLAYARLERGTGSRVLENVTAGAILERAQPPLLRRCEEAGMNLVTDLTETDRQVPLHTDPIAVEQIIFNLVDNASKYAAGAGNKCIHLAVSANGRHMEFRVCDHGPGLKRSERRIAFQPFRKSAARAAQTAPGVGLGLALCRQLARQLGGDLVYEDHTDYGACFTLRLPRQRAGKG